MYKVKRMLPGFCSLPLENWTVRLQHKNEMRAEKSREYGGEEMNRQWEEVTDFRNGDSKEARVLTQSCPGPGGKRGWGGVGAVRGSLRTGLHGKE